MKVFLIKTILSIVLIYILLIGVIFFCQRSLMYFPQDGVTDDVAKGILPHADIIQVTTEDNINLKAYLIPPKDISKPIILAFHGNASLAIYMAEQFNPIIQEGAGLLLAEYRGYGGNSGEPTEQGLYKDASAYLDFIRQYYPKHKIISYGQSLGSAIAVNVVYKNPDKFSALILEVPFDSALNVASKAYPFVPFKNILLKDKYESDKKIGNITIPKLFLIAVQDDVVGADTGKRLYELANEPKEVHIFNDATHVNVFSYGAAQHINQFISNNK
jgi:fermentation-respiration switch protein FrsA (DUF1100 family)